MNTTETRQNDASIVVEVWGPNYWWKAGHCRRCVNGRGHTIRRRGAGGEKPSGTILKRTRRHIYLDELAPDEKKTLRRQQRHRESASLRRRFASER